MRVIYLTGVVEDGGPPSTAVPDDPRTTLTYRQGEKLQVVYTVRTRSGALVPLADKTVTLTVRKTPLDPVTFRQARNGSTSGVLLSQDGPGVVRLTILPTDLPPNRAPFGRWTFDVGVAPNATPTDVSKTTPLSTLMIEPGDL